MEHINQHVLYVLVHMSERTEYLQFQRNEHSSSELREL